ncbi:MAG: hypothetical protein ACFFKA_10935 [Candidatus Thorarchaeota archaeon]
MKEVYYNFLVITIVTLLVACRIAVAIYLSRHLFKNWFSYKQQSFGNIPFLLGLYFYSLITGKFLDLIVYTIWVDVFLFSYTILLFLLKVRFFLTMFNMLPLLIFGGYLYIFKRSLKEEDFVTDKQAKIYTLLLTIIFFSFYTISIIFIQDVDYFPVLLAIITLLSFSLVIWVFFTAFKGKILPEINSRIIAIGFTLLLIFNVIVSPLMFTIGQIADIGLIYVVLILESGTLLSTFVILIGLKTKAKF